MRLIFINRFYWPETPATSQLLADLAEGLAARGHDVTVITSGAVGNHPRRETHRGVAIWRVRGTRWAHLGLAGKAADFASFYLGAMWRLHFEAASDSTVVALTDPPLLAIGSGFVSRLRRARIIHWVQDIYPELAIELAGQSWLSLLRPLRDREWWRATACVTLGTDMASVLAAAGVEQARTAIIPNWAPAGTLLLPRSASETLRAEWKLQGKFVVMYSGNLGRVHDLDPVLDVAARLRDEPDVAFLFVGHGAQKTALQAEVTRRALTNVFFQPPQPRERLAESLAVGDVHLVTLRPGCERLVFPSKLYGIAAAGRPVCFIGPHDCEVAQIVRARDLGHAAPRDDAGGVAAFIQQLARDPATTARHAAAAQQFAVDHDVNAAVSAWESLLIAEEA